MVSTAAFHARVRGSVPGLGGLKKTKMFLPHPRVKVSIEGNLLDREVACSASDRQGSNFESCVWRTVSSQSSHHPQEVLLAQFSLFVHKGGLKPDSFHFLIKIGLKSAKIGDFILACKHVHRLELQKFFFYFLCSHLPVRLDREEEIHDSFFLDMHVQNKKYGDIVSISSLTGKCAAQKLKKNLSAVVVYGHVYIIWLY